MHDRPNHRPLQNSRHEVSRSEVPPQGGGFAKGITSWVRSGKKLGEGDLRGGASLALSDLDCGFTAFTILLGSLLLGRHQILNTITNLTRRM